MREANNGNRSALHSLAYRDILEGKAEEALALLGNHPEDAEGRLLKAIAHYTMGEYGNAYNSFDQADLDLPEALAFQARCCLEMGEKDKARELLAAAWLNGLPNESYVQINTEDMAVAGYSALARVAENFAPGLAKDIDRVMRMEIMEGRLDEAIALADGTASPTATQRLLKAVALAIKGDISEASAELRVESPMDEADEWMYSVANAVIAFADHRIDDAIRLLKVGEWPAAVDILLARFLILNGDLTSAWQQVRNIDRDELNPQNTMDLADIYASLGDSATAEELYHSLMQDMDSNSDDALAIRYRLAQLRLKVGETEAVSEMRTLAQDALKALSDDPSRRHLHILRAACFRDAGDMEHAKAIVAFLRELFPGDSRVDNLI